MNTGKYSAQAVDATLGYSKNGKQQIEILFEVKEGPSKGERISFFGSFSGEAATYTLEAMRTCGWSAGRDVKEVCKKQVTIDVYDEEYNGRMLQKVRIFQPSTDLRTKPEHRMSSADADEFLNRLCGVAEPDESEADPVDDIGF